MKASRILAGGALAGVLFVANGFGTSVLAPGVVKKISMGVSPVLFLLWFSGHYLWQRDRIRAMGTAGYIVSMVGAVFFVVWETVGHHKFGPVATGLMAMLCAWGFLMYGTASLATGIVPRAATMLWICGVLLVRWKFSPALVSIGILW